MKPLDLYDHPLSQASSFRDTLVFFMRGLSVRRFHNAMTLKENTVGHHSAGVAMFCDFLTAYSPSANLLRAAIYHDMAEQVTGDMPAPAKRLLGLRKTLQDCEDTVLSNHGANVELTVSEKRILKIADCFDGLLFCISERMLGNKFIEFQGDRFAIYASELLNRKTGRASIMHRALLELWIEVKGETTTCQPPTTE